MIFDLRNEGDVDLVNRAIQGKTVSRIIEEILKRKIK